MNVYILRPTTEKSAIKNDMINNTLFIMEIGNKIN
jgi:hypothetical protein